MNSRIKLHNLLKEILGNDNVYFQPPQGLKMNYPAIKYKRERIEHVNADNINYISHHSYELIVIDKNPDSEIVEKVSNLPQCSHRSNYAKDGLNYDVFGIYYDE